MQRVLVLLSPGFEEIEAVTVIDILRRAEIDVTIAGLERGIVTGAHGIPINCDLYYEQVNSEKFNAIFLPGGQPGTDNLKKDPTVLTLIRQFYNDNKIVAAICAAPTVLYTAGILAGKKVTSYPTEKEVFSESNYTEDKVVQDGNIITSRGVGTAIDFALTLVEVMKGKQQRKTLSERLLWGQ
jgi:4-methyl-5(b-hydroxyethyl)-thiazole monophosphate biosynthesis